MPWPGPSAPSSRWMATSRVALRLPPCWWREYWKLSSAIRERHRRTGGTMRRIPVLANPANPLQERSMSELSQFKAEFFKALAHPLRIRILDSLRKGEVSVNELSARLTVEQSHLSQQLAVLRGRGIVVGRKEGNNVYYSIQDPEIFRLLDIAKKIFNNRLIDVRDLLAQL